MTPHFRSDTLSVSAAIKPEPFCFEAARHIEYDTDVHNSHGNPDAVTIPYSEYWVMVTVAGVPVMANESEWHRVPVDKDRR